MSKERVLAAIPRYRTVTAGRRFYRDGFLLQMANPKGIAFFSAIVPQFVDPGSPVATQILILGVTSMLSNFCVFALYGMVAGRASPMAPEPRYLGWANPISPGVSTGAGAGVARP